MPQSVSGSGRRTLSRGTLSSRPYLVIIDFGNPERARFAGRSALAPRLNDRDWQRMMAHITALSTLAWREYGVRAVIHPRRGLHRICR